MERSTAKTMDCYVELLTQADAEEALSWVNRNLPAHSPRLGDRHVHVEMSSQDALLREIFPRAKCVLWKNGIPEIQPNTDRYSTGFQGFLTNEELFCMVHYAEAPKRVSLYMSTAACGLLLITSVGSVCREVPATSLRVYDQHP